MAIVTELVCYPVKGCAGISMTEASVTDLGLAHDRAFLVTDEAGVFRSQRRDPGLAIIQPEITADGRSLTLSAPGAGSVRVEVDTDSVRRPVKLFREPFQGIDQGEPVAEWLSEVLGKPSRLACVPPEHDRVTDGLFPSRSAYADSSAIHLLSQATQDELNRRLADAGSPPLPMTRFRPNIVVDGWDLPHTEDAARRIEIGDIELGHAEVAIRCVVTTVDQEAGVKAGPEPLRTLATYRRASEGGIAYGIKCAVTRTGKLSVGDEVQVTEWMPL